MKGSFRTFGPLALYTAPIYGASLPSAFARPCGPCYWRVFWRLHAIRPTLFS